MDRWQRGSWRPIVVGLIAWVGIVGAYALIRRNCESESCDVLTVALAIALYSVPVGLVTGIAAGLLRRGWLGLAASAVALTAALPFLPQLASGYVNGGSFVEAWIEVAIPFAIGYVPPAAIAGAIFWIWRQTPALRQAILARPQRWLTVAAALLAVSAALLVFAIFVVKPALDPDCRVTASAIPAGYRIAFDGSAGTCVASQTDGARLVPPGSVQRPTAPATEDQRVLSPDGRLYAFSADKDYQWHPNIYVESASSGTPTRVTAVAPDPEAPEPSPAPGDTCSPPGYLMGTQEDSEPAWSPDGQYLAFVRTESRTGDGPTTLSVVCVMRPDGSDLRGIAMDAMNPVWLPSNQ